MTQTHTLTRPRDIQNWVSERKGTPAIVRVRNTFGQERSKLELRFSRSDEGVHDAGMSPCSWTAWLAELERQQLALRIEPAGGFAFVSRTSLN